MAFIRVFKSRCQIVDPVKKLPVGQDSSGIALFIVMAAIGVLAILVTEFTYVSQITQAVAFGSLDQVKVHYLAKSALKLSLLRLKAYKNVKGIASNLGVGAAAQMPKGLIDQIWSFPFSYPIPSNIPGLSQIDRDTIDKFQKESGFEGGSYRTKIESESSKYNLNVLLSSYVPTAAASPLPTSPIPPPGQPAPTPQPEATGTVSFNADSAREGLFTYLNGIINQKILTDSEFADNRRNFRLQDLVDNISSWVDRKFEHHSGSRFDSKIPFKKAPFYSISELHMIPTMDDELYNLLTPTLTTSTTNGININTMREPVLRALIPKITTEEVTDFFKFRDGVDADNKFKSEDDFFAYLQKGISIFINNPQAVADFKASLTQQNIRFITDESQFKIMIAAQVNNSIRVIEAWVELSSDDSKKTTSPGASTSQGTSQGSSQGGSPDGVPDSNVSAPGGRTIPDPGLRITFMKII